jgi:hypothetical protein
MTRLGGIVRRIRKTIKPSESTSNVASLNFSTHKFGQLFRLAKCENWATGGDVKILLASLELRSAQSCRHSHSNYRYPVSRRCAETSRARETPLNYQNVLEADAR